MWQVYCIYQKQGLLSIFRLYRQFFYQFLLWIIFLRVVGFIPNLGCCDTIEIVRVIIFNSINCMSYTSDVYVWLAIRFSLAGIFLWAFFDKLFGLGLATAADKAWIRGGSPTSGFLQFGTTGPLRDVFNALSGSVLVDWLFMLGLLGIGLALLLGVGMKIAGWSGAVLMLLMWLALLFPKNNPILDEHIVYLILFLGLATVQVRPGDYWGLGKWWRRKQVVQRYPFLQ